MIEIIISWKEWSKLFLSVNPLNDIVSVGARQITNRLVLQICSDGVRVQALIQGHLGQAVELAFGYLLVMPMPVLLLPLSRHRHVRTALRRRSRHVMHCPT